MHVRFIIFFFFSGKINSKKNNPKREAECSSSSDPSCFLANVMPSTLRYDSLVFYSLYLLVGSVSLIKKSHVV